MTRIKIRSELIVDEEFNTALRQVSLQANLHPAVRELLVGLHRRYEATRDADRPVRRIHVDAAGQVSETRLHLREVLSEQPGELDKRRITEIIIAGEQHTIPAVDEETGGENGVVSYQVADRKTLVAQIMEDLDWFRGLADLHELLGIGDAEPFDETEVHRMLAPNATELVGWLSHSEEADGCPVYPI